MTINELSDIIYKFVEMAESQCEDFNVEFYYDKYTDVSLDNIQLDYDVETGDTTCRINLK